MKVGLDARNSGQVAAHGVVGTLRYASQNGFDGVFFRSVLDLSKTLDPGELRSVRALADDLGLYLEAGIGRVNPYNTVLNPEVRIVGEGDYLRGIERMVQAAHSIGCYELWGELATYSPGLPGIYAFDRFRTDVAWPEQLEASEKFLLKLAPLLRELGCRINLENHEETTTYDLIRIIEQVGADITGITLDTINLLYMAEDPPAAVGRAAPYTHQLHAKDAALYFVDSGLEWQLRPCGQGVIDWERILPILEVHVPGLNLSIEDLKLSMKIRIYDRTWRESNLDLSTDELANVVRLARMCEEKMKQGEILDVKTYEEIPFDEAQRLSRLQASAKHLRMIVRRLDKIL